MSLETAVAALMVVGLVFYAVLGGADFGSGFYDLTAGDAARGAELRTLVDRSIGPVWEANHVWLIFVLVLGWTSFPLAYAAVMSTLAVPLLAALLGIVLRGASFAFRKYAESLAQARLLGVVFATSSVITPFFLGATAGSIASGRVAVDDAGPSWTAWLSVTSVTCGFLAVGTCSFLAGVFLVAEAARRGQVRLAESLRRRAIVVGLATGGIVVAALVPVSRDAPLLGAGLRERGWPFVLGSVVAGVLALGLMVGRRFGLARWPATVAVASVVVGWAVGQYPWLLVGEMTLAEGAGAEATLQGVLVVGALGAVFVAPALGTLLWLTQSDRWSSGPPVDREAHVPKLL